ncbi:MAG: hypothetical protein ABI192_00380 [Bradyrhizobium sp.]
MKMLKRLLQFSSKPWFSRKPWRIRRKPRPVTDLYSVVEPDEFARLLRSGRTEDLKILARKLSQPAKVRI